MFDFVTKNKRLIQIVLAIIFLPFAFFGVDVYFRDIGSGQSVARVAGQPVSQEEFARALRERQLAIQRAMEGKIDPALLDNPEMRFATLESVIQRRLLLDRAMNTGLTVADSHLKSAIRDVQVFRDDKGAFSFPQYEQFLKSEGMTPVTFEARMRQDILLQQMSNGYAGNAFAPRTVVDLVLRLSGERRELSHATLAPEQYLAQVKLDPGAAKKHYDANAGEFRVPEQVRAEYVMLSIESLMQGIRIEPDEVRKYYDGNQRQFGVEERRQAAHILVSGEAGAEARQKARAKAEALYQQLQKNPAGFAEAAKKQSQDPGSAAGGGDLGFISRGMMKDVPEFEEALFRLKPGEISQPVETKLGFHIIRLTALQPSRVKPFEEARGQIEKELAKQAAARRFAELADSFNNVVYEQSDSLKPAADLVKTAPVQSGWISRTGAEPPLNNPKLLAAIFSEETLRNKRNTEAIEVAPGLVIAARVIEYKPESIRPFDEVRAGLEKRLALREASRLAAEEGRRQLEALRQGNPVKIGWSPPIIISRDRENKEIPAPVVRHAFRMDVAKLPAYSGLTSPQGSYVLLRVSRVQEAEGVTPEKTKALADQLRGVMARETMAAYVASLRQQGEVTINKEQVEKKQ